MRPLLFLIISIVCVIGVGGYMVMNSFIETHPQQVCKSTIPTILSWQKTLPHTLVTYYYAETVDRSIIRIIYQNASASKADIYFEEYDKNNHISNQYISAEGLCVHTTITDTNLYYDPFQYAPCVADNYPWYATASREPITVATFTPPVDCNSGEITTAQSLQKEILQWHVQENK